jgi:hypothetical protein
MPSTQITTARVVIGVSPGCGAFRTAADLAMYISTALRAVGGQVAHDDAVGVTTSIPLLHGTLQAAGARNPAAKVGKIGRRLDRLFEDAMGLLHARGVRRDRFPLRMSQITPLGDGEISRAQELYGANQAFHDVIDRHSRVGVNAARASLTNNQPLTDEEWGAVRPGAVKYLLHEMDHFNGTLRKHARDAGAARVLFVYHGDVGWLNGFPTGAYGEADWAIPYDEVGYKWLSLPSSMWASQTSPEGRGRDNGLASVVITDE